MAAAKVRFMASPCFLDIVSLPLGYVVTGVWDNFT